jgi:hypothetical protein
MRGWYDTASGTSRQQRAHTVLCTSVQPMCTQQPPMPGGEAAYYMLPITGCLQIQQRGFPPTPLLSSSA